MMTEQTWLLWQIADSAFPTGTFAHSGGLEAAWQSGEVSDANELGRFVREAIGQAGRGTLPLLTAAYTAPARIEALDALADAFLTNAVANRASRVQGRAFASTCARVWPTPAALAIDRRARAINGHYAPIAGGAARALELPLEAMQRLLLFQTARGVLAAAVRLGVIGSYEGQRLLFECGSLLDAVLEQCRGLDESDLTHTAPLVDIMQSAHDRMYSRLFQS